MRFTEHHFDTVRPFKAVTQRQGQFNVVEIDKLWWNEWPIIES
jgi:hypothetical protein